jgi:hypothetical protein
MRIIKLDEMGRACSRNAYIMLVGKRLLGRPKHKWVDNIRMDLGEVRWGDVDWIGLAQDMNRCRDLVNSVMNLRVPKDAGKRSNVLTTAGLSSSARLHS